MNLTVRFFGLEILSIEASTDEPVSEDDTARDLSGGNTTSTELGFVRSEPQRWEPGADL